METERKKILEMRNITKSFPGTKALDNVDLLLFENEILGLVGGNGAGKSTLMKILSGEIKKDNGDIIINEKIVNINSPLDSQIHGIHIVHQELALFPTLSVAENIYMNKFPTVRFLKLIRNSRLISQTKEISKRLDLSVNPSEKVENLAIGQQQIVEILRAISDKAEILIFDEPTSSLSLHEKKKLFEIIRYLRNSGTSVIFISHNFEEVFDICERIVVLKDGKNAGSRNVKETNASEIAEMMIGESVDTFYQIKKPKIGKKILECKNLSKIGTFYNINLKVHSGEIVGLWGLLGSGRTELARAIYGLDKFDKGEVLLESIDNKRNEKLLGFISENRREEGLFLSLSVIENITISKLKSVLNKTHFFISRKKEIDVCQNLVKQLNIKISNLNQKVESLSGGNQQKQILARWFFLQPCLYILDEPTRGLDISAKEDVYSLFSNFTESGAGILLISSDVDELINLSDRVYVIANGKIIDEFDKNNINRKKLIEVAS